MKASRAQARTLRAVENVAEQQNQLDRIEAKLDKLLAQKEPSARTRNSKGADKTAPKPEPETEQKQEK